MCLGSICQGCFWILEYLFDISGKHERLNSVKHVQHQTLDQGGRADVPIAPWQNCPKTSLLSLPFHGCPFGLPTEDFANCSWRLRKCNRQESKSLFIPGKAYLFLVSMEKKTKVHGALEWTTNGTRTNAVKRNAKAVIPHQQFGWVSCWEQHGGGCGPWCRKQVVCFTQSHV